MPFLTFLPSYIFGPDLEIWPDSWVLMEFLLAPTPSLRRVWETINNYQN